MEEIMSSYMKLEDILFQYERQAAQIDVLQMLIADGPVDIAGAPKKRYGVFTV